MVKQCQQQAAHTFPARGIDIDQQPGSSFQAPTISAAYLFSDGEIPAPKPHGGDVLDRAGEDEFLPNPGVGGDGHLVRVIQARQQGAGVTVPIDGDQGPYLTEVDQPQLFV